MLHPAPGYTCTIDPIGKGGRMRLTESRSNNTSTCITSSRTTVRFHLWSYWEGREECDIIEHKEQHKCMRWFILSRTKVLLHL